MARPGGAAAETPRERNVANAIAHDSATEMTNAIAPTRLV
jgi:hypothetical protein